MLKQLYILDSWQEMFRYGSTSQLEWYARVERRSSANGKLMQLGEGHHVDREEAVRRAVAASRLARTRLLSAEQADNDAEHYDRTTPAEQVDMSMHGAI